MFAAIARKVIAHPWWTIAAWVVLAALAIVLSPNLSNYTTGNQEAFLPTKFESVKAQNVGNKYFPTQSGAVGSLVVTRSDGGVLTSSDQQEATKLATTLQNEKLTGVTSVQATPQSLSQDKKVMALQVAFSGQPGDEVVNSGVDALRTSATNNLKGTDLTSGLTGNAAIQVDTTSAYDKADTTITIATVVLILLLLTIIFRSPIISVLPLIVIGIVLQVVTGLTAAISALFNIEVSTILKPLLVVVLFGIGTDYIVFMLFRYREQLRSGDRQPEALLSSVSVIGKVVASSALTVLGAFAALLAAKLGSLNSLAPGLIVAVIVMLVTALTLVPAILSLLGKHLFWPLGPGHDSKRRPYDKLGSLVSRKPAIIGGSVAVVMIVLAIFSGGFKSTYNTLSELPSSTLSRQAYDTLNQSFPPGSLSPTQVFVTSNSSAKLTQSSLTTLQSDLAGVKGVASVTPAQLSSDGTAALLNVVLASDPYDNSSMDLVGGTVRSTAHGKVPGATVLVGGQTSTLYDVRDQLKADTNVVFPIAAVIIIVILGLLLYALLAPLNLLVCVGLAFASTLGAVTIVFLHLAGVSGVDFSIPIVLYLFVVAIGTDYNILIAARLHEEFHDGHEPRETVRIAISNDAPTAAAAGVILAFTFASLMLTGLANLIQLGFGVAFGIVIAAFGMAPLLVPSLAGLQGRHFWWPTRMQRSAQEADEPEPASS